jgi:hypothetical protein
VRASIGFCSIRSAFVTSAPELPPEHGPSSAPDKTSAAFGTHTGERAFGSCPPRTHSILVPNRRSMPHAAGRELPLFRNHPARHPTAEAVEASGFPTHSRPRPRPRSVVTNRDRTANDVRDDDEVQHPASETHLTGWRTHRHRNRKWGCDQRGQLAPPRVGHLAADHRLPGGSNAWSQSPWTSNSCKQQSVDPRSQHPRFEGSDDVPDASPRR